MEILHRNEISKELLEKNYNFPCVIGETESDLIEIIDSDSFNGFGKNDGVKQLHEKLIQRFT